MYYYIYAIGCFHSVVAAASVAHKIDFLQPSWRMQSRVEQLETEVADLHEEVELLSSGLSALREHVTRLERKAERVARANGPIAPQSPFPLGALGIERSAREKGKKLQPHLRGNLLSGLRRGHLRLLDRERNQFLPGCNVKPSVTRLGNSCCGRCLGIIALHLGGISSPWLPAFGSWCRTTRATATTR